MQHAVSQDKAAGKASAGLKVVKDGATAKGGALHEVLGLSAGEMVSWYKLMLTMRRFEEKAASLYQQKEIAGFCHLYIGQEAVAAAAKAASKDGDDFITSYRCHALALVCGVPPEAVMGELTGRAIGISKGKGGSMHMFDPSLGFWGGHGIVAAQVPLGAGIAFARKYQHAHGAGSQEPGSQVARGLRVCYTFIGDGAMNAGQTLEAFNMAALWKLPVIFVIENNQYGMGTSVARAAAGELYKRAEPFGIPAERVDGMDFLASLAAFRKASEYARTGKGPYVLEMDTYRYRGHSMSDPAKYRTREDVECVREKRDPLIQMQKYMTEHLRMSEGEFEAFDEEVKAKIAKVAEVATTAPRADASELLTDVLPV